MSKHIQVTANELLEELRRGHTSNAPADALTCREIGAALGIGHSAVKERLKRIRLEGRLAVWTKCVIDSAGRTQAVPAYTIAPKRKGK